jgi:hypothetical protein
MAAVLTEFDVWDFKKDEEGRWTWQRLSPDGEVLLQARDAFEDLEQCQADAARHRYLG